MKPEIDCVESKQAMPMVGMAGPKHPGPCEDERKSELVWSETDEEGPERLRLMAKGAEPSVVRDLKGRRGPRRRKSHAKSAGLGRAQERADKESSRRKKSKAKGLGSALEVMRISKKGSEHT